MGVKKLSRSEQDESHTHQEMEGQSARMRAIVKKKIGGWMDDVGEWIRGEKKGKGKIKS